MCTLCQGEIKDKLAVRMHWTVSPRLGGIGYFHRNDCAEAMLKAVQDEQKRYAAEQS